MAEYKLVNTEKLESDLTNIADKIRILNGTTEPLTLDEMAVALDGIEIGVELPELSNPATAEEVFLNKEFIDEDGNSVTGTFSIDNELSNQDNLISQIQTALQNKASATGEDVTSETNIYTSKLATLETAITALETELQGKASGGTSVETCTVTISFKNGDPKDVWISGTQLINGNIQPFSFIDRSNIPNSFASPYTISNIVKNTPIIISGQGNYAISSTPLIGNGCELLYSSITTQTLAVNITEPEATITIRNDY